MCYQFAKCIADMPKSKSTALSEHVVDNLSIEKLSTVLIINYIVTITFVLQKLPSTKSASRNKYVYNYQNYRYI